MADTDINDWQEVPASPAPINDWQEVPLNAAPASPFFDNLHATVGGALKDIGSDTLESLKNAATSTGEAISNPNPNAPWLLQRLGQVGNAIQGAGEALFSPVTGALTASAQATMPLQESVLGAKGQLTPAQEHQIAQEEGSYMAGGVGAAMGANAKSNITAQQQGLPPAAAPYNPFQPMLDNAANADDAPRMGFLASNSSDPFAQPPIPMPDMDALKAASSVRYQQMRDQGATLNQDGISSVTSSVDQALKNSGMMNKNLHGDTLSVVDDLKQDAASGQMDLEKLDQYRQLLGNVVTDNTSKIDGANQDALKANVAIKAIDDAVNSLGAPQLSNGTPQAVEALNQARDLYSASSRMRDLQRIQDNAYMTDNPATAMRTGFKNLAKQVNASPRGWSQDEVDAINYAAHTGIVTGALKTMGSRLISGVAGAAGGAVGGGIPGAIAGAGVGEAVAFPLRAAANSLQANRGNAVINLVANRPAVKAALNPSTPMAAPTPAAAQPVLALPAPNTVMSTDSFGRIIPISPAGRDILGQSAGTAAEQRPVINAQNFLQRGAVTNSALDRLIAEQQAQKQAQMNSMFQANGSNPQELVANSAQKFNDAGISIGDFGQALLNILLKKQ